MASSRLDGIARIAGAAALALISAAVPLPGYSQELGAPLTAPTVPAADSDAALNGAAAGLPDDEDVDPMEGTGIDASESDGDIPRRSLVKFNEYEGPYFSFRLGFGFLVDTAGYAQDDDSETQLTLVPKQDLRDFRLIGKGRLMWPWLTYTIGYMYDETNGGWAWRQTGINIDFPSLQGALFIGRTKENFDTSKMMVGYQGWTNERAAINDAFLPILNDGIKWRGYNASNTLLYSIGFFDDEFSDNEGFNKNDTVTTGRLVWLPFAADKPRLLHLAAELRYGTSDNGFLQYRSKPESYEAQSYAIDTGKFPAKYSMMYGLESYYRDGPLLIGSEYFFNQVESPGTHDPFFHGGEIFVAYTLTGEAKPYAAHAGYFERISPSRPVFEGGPGAWEAVLRYSYADLDSNDIQGGTFWRITPMMNWHMSDNVRLEFVTGYGMLDRFDTRGGTVFAQTRLQLQL